MTKTPYEIRLELLNFAQGQLSGQYFAEMERIRSMTKQDSPEQYAAFEKLRFPTKSDIIILAEELKSFVDNK